MTESFKNLTPERQNEWLFTQYNSGHASTWRQTAVNMKAFLRGLQWKGEDARALEANNQAAITDNEVTPAIELLISNLCENEPRFATAGRENSDSKTAANVADFLSYLWDKSDGNEKTEQAVFDAEYSGLFAYHAYIDFHADNGKPEIKFYCDDPLEVFIDPNSKREDTEDAAHKLLVCIKTREQIENWIPDFNFKEAQIINESDIPEHDRHAGENQILNVTDFTHERYRVIDRYTKFKDRRFKVTDTTNRFVKIFIEDEYIEYSKEPAIVLVKNGKEMYVTEELIVKEWLQRFKELGQWVHIMSDGTYMSGVEHAYISPQGTMPIQGSTTMIQPTTKNELLNLGIIKWEKVLIDRIRRVLTIGNKLVENSVMPISHYPIITGMLHHNRNPFPQGDVEFVKPLQEQLNNFNSKLIAYLSAVANIKVLLPEGTKTKQYEENWAKAGAQFFTYDAEIGVPIVVQVPPLPAGFFQERQTIISQIQRILGSYSFQDGDVQNAPNTYGGTLTIEENMQKRVRFKRKKIERAINRLARVMMEMIPHVYTEEKEIRILRPNHAEKRIKFNQVEETEQGSQIINDLSLEYDVMMVSGSMMPTNRMARFQMLESLYERKVLQDRTLILEQLDLPNMDEIIQREDMLIQAQQVIEQLNQQVKTLQGQLQTKSRENIQLMEKVEVEKFKTATGKIKNKAESSVLLAQQRLGDMVKDKKQNIKDKKNGRSNR